MFTPWVAKCELISASNDSHVLKKFSDKCQRGLCSMVVGFLNSEGVDMNEVLPSAHHIRWAMESIGHSFALSIEESDVITGAIRIYEKWLRVDTSSAKDYRPTCLQKSEQAFIQDMIGHMTLIFDERQDNSRSIEVLASKHVSLSLKVLSIFEALARKRGSDLTPPTWDRMMRLLLGCADNVLHGNRNFLRNHISGQMIHILFEVYLRSLSICGPKGDLWNLLQKFTRRWIHRKIVVEQWNCVTLALTRALMKRINGSSSDGPKESRQISLQWVNKAGSMIELEGPYLAYSWYRLLRVLGHPTGIGDPDVYLTAIRGIRRLSEEFCFMERLSSVQWDQIAREEPFKKGVNSRSPPDVNTILRILGPWLFDACLNRKPRYGASRSEALSCLGALICQYYSGRSKRIHWPYGIRSLIALQNALLDEDERINAAAVYNWSKIFGLFGNHTLRGAGILAGTYHKAVDRFLRMERKDVEIGGISVILLRRACIEACSSLLTIHAHLPRSVIKEAEREVVPAEMCDMQGLLSTLPKFTRFNVVGLLINALKTELDPTNQQMIMWILTVAIQQESSIWSSGVVSSRNSQVPVTILTICSIVTKSGRYKPPVLFTAFECLRQLSPMSEDLFFYAMSSVNHLVNSCCEFIATNGPILRSSRAPFYLDALMAAAYECILDWVVAVPQLLSKPQLMSKILATLADAVEQHAYTQKSKFPVDAVLHAAQKLLNALLKQHATDTPATEKMILSEHGGTVTEDAFSRCKFFGVDRSRIITVVEGNSIDGKDEAVLIVRDAFGRYSWRIKPRYKAIPLPKSPDEFEDMVELQEMPSKEDKIQYFQPKIEDQQCNEEEDPLLSAIRDGSSDLLSWKGNKAIDSSHNNLEVLPGEGNSGLSTVIEKKASIAKDEFREVQDLFFARLLDIQSKEDNECKLQPGTTLQLPGCRPPKHILHDCDSWNISRRMMVELGFVTIENWGSVVPLNNSTLSSMNVVLHEIEKIDRISEKESFEIGVAYAVSESSIGGHDNIRVLSYKNLQKTTLSEDYEDFLASLGEYVDLSDHTGFRGTIDGEGVTGKLLYYSEWSYETCFYVPTIPIQSNLREIDPVRLLERANVLILWNECQQNYLPGTTLWAKYRLPIPSSNVYIIIDPLGNDLYCVHVCTESSPLFHCQSKSEKSSYVDEGEVFRARVLGPLQNGMVVNGAWLGPLIRQTAINAAILTRAFQRYQDEVGVISSATITAQANRKEHIASFLDKHIRPTLPGVFYRSLFTTL